MKHVSVLSVVALAALHAVGAEPLRGRESWAGIKAHPAVVNPVARPADDPQTLSLRGTWDFYTDAPCKHYNTIGNMGFDGCGRGWSSPERCRKIQVPGCWESQGVGDRKSVV